MTHPGRLVRIERESDGFFPSFDTAATQQWLPFMQQHGFVILKVLSPQECAATVAEFVEDVNSRQDPSRRKANVDLNDPTTWVDENWPCKGRHLVDYAPLTPHAMANRTHPNVHAAFAALYGTPALQCHVDCWGVMRGTSQLPWRDDPEPSDDKDCLKAPPTGEGPGEYYAERPEWRTSLPPHWDVNPWWYVEDQRAGHPPMYQSVLALVDCPDETGGFCVGPGTPRLLPQWCAAVPPQKGATKTHYDIATPDVWAKDMQHVPLRAGELVVWDSGALHCNFANFGPRCRVVQYLRCVPAGGLSDTDPLRSRYTPAATSERLGVDYSTLPGLTPLGRKLLGVDSW